MNIVMADHDQLPNTRGSDEWGFLHTCCSVSPSRRAETQYAITSESARGRCLATHIALGLIWRHNPRREGLRAAGVEA